MTSSDDDVAYGSVSSPEAAGRDIAAQLESAKARIAELVGCMRGAATILSEGTPASEVAWMLRFVVQDDPHSTLAARSASEETQRPQGATHTPTPNGEG